MTNQTTKIQTTEDMLKRILHMLEESQERSTSGNGTSNECRIYTNKELMKLLGVESRYLKIFGIMVISPIPDTGISSGTHRMMLTHFYDASSMKHLPVEEVQYVDAI